MTCGRCGGEVSMRPFASGSPNGRWAVCSECGHMEPVFAGDDDWVDWDCPVNVVDGTPILPFPKNFS